MRLDSDYEGIAQERTRSWEAELCQRQLRAQITRQPPRWRRIAGAWLMAAGRRLTHWGAAMAEHERSQPMSVAG